MKKALCTMDLSNSFKKGKAYEVIYAEASYAILKDETGMAHGVKEWKKHFNF